MIIGRGMGFRFKITHTTKLIMLWNKISKDNKPMATESGPWDGLRTDRLLVCTRGGNYFVVRMYEGVLDGSEFCDFYDEQNNQIDNVTAWIDIDHPF